MVALVTGGAGFIGSHLVKELLKKGFQVVIVDNLSNGKITNLTPFIPNVVTVDNSNFSETLPEKIGQKKGNSFLSNLRYQSENQSNRQLTDNPSNRKLDRKRARKLIQLGTKPVGTKLENKPTDLTGNPLDNISQLLPIPSSTNFSTSTEPISLPYSQTHPFFSNLTLYCHSITDRDFIRDLLRFYKFDYIFHLGAVASVQRAMEEPVATHQINMDGTLYLLEEAVRNWQVKRQLKRFLFASSAAVYGDDPTLPKLENSPIKPISPYGIDKFAAEQYLLQFHRLYQLPGVALRYFNVFGPNQNPESPYSGVISIFGKQFLSQAQPEITIYGNGRQTRDFIYVTDVIKANLLVIEHPKAIGEVFNVATGRETSLLELVKIFSELTGKKAKIRFTSSRSGDIYRSVASIEKIGKLGFVPKFSLKEGLQAMIRAYN